MADITLFNFEGSSVRVHIDGNGEPWFVAKDVCGVLGHTNSRQATSDNVDPEDVSTADSPTSGGVQAVTTVNESGLYSLIMGSRLGGLRDQEILA